MKTLLRALCAFGLHLYTRRTSCGGHRCACHKVRYHTPRSW